MLLFTVEESSVDVSCGPAAADPTRPDPASSDPGRVLPVLACLGVFSRVNLYLVLIVLFFSMIKVCVSVCGGVGVTSVSTILNVLKPPEMLAGLPPFDHAGAVFVPPSLPVR